MSLSTELLLGLPPIFLFTYFVLLDVSASITGSQHMYHMEIFRPCLNMELRDENL